MLQVLCCFYILLGLGTGAFWVVFYMAGLLELWVRLCRDCCTLSNSN